MDATTLLTIGQYQPFPFPAPVWLMQTLLVAGFYLHMIPMNLALMGGFISAFFLIKGRLGQSPDSEYETRTGMSIARGLPVFTSVAITNGIVPLLFLQVLYGPLVYPSSIAMAAPWFGILFLLLIGYYSIYAFTYKHKDLGEKASWLLILASILFMVIAFLFTNNMTLMLTPEKFLPMVQDSPSGWNLNLTEPTLIPRYLHFLLGALAVNGLLIGGFGLYQQKRDPEYSGWLLRSGGGLFLSITILQSLFIGPWFLLSQPDAIVAQFFGGDKFATMTLMISFLLDLIAVVAMAVAVVRKSAPAFWVSLWATLGLLAGMVITRHNLRVFMLEGVFSPNSHPADPQWDLLAVFGVMVIFTIIFLTWLGKVVWRGFHPSKA